MNNSPDILNKLETVYQRSLRAKQDKIFFQSMYDYIEVFDSIPELVEVNQEIIRLAEEETKPALDLEEIAQQEILHTYKKVKRYATKKKISNPVLTRNLRETEEAWRGELISSSGKTKEMYDSLAYALMTIIQDCGLEHLRYCRQYGTINSKGRINNWDKISPTYLKWQEQHKINQRLHVLTAWYAWDQVVNFHNDYQNYEDKQGKLLKKKDYWTLGYVAEKFLAIESAMTGKESREEIRISIDRDEYQQYLDRVHQFINDELSHQSKKAPSNNISDDVARRVKWSILNKNISIIINVNNKDVIFSTSDRTGKTLQCLTQSENEIVSWDEIYEKWTGQEPSLSEKSNLKMKVYWNIKAISRRIASETGATNLIEYKSGDVSFNTSYIQLPDQTNT